MPKIDDRSKEWKIVEAWASERLAKERESNEEPGTKVRLTEGHRGAIRVLKELLALPNSSSQVVSKGGPNNYDMGV